MCECPTEWSSDEIKDLFFNQLGALTAGIPGFEFLIPCGDWNGHVGRAGTVYSEVHGGMGYGRPEPDVEGDKTLEYAFAFNLLRGNTCSKKHDSHLITYKSGKVAMQIDVILLCRTMGKLVTDVKVIPGEEVALQHQLLVCNMRIDVPSKSKRKFSSHLKVWKLIDHHRLLFPGGLQLTCKCVFRCSADAATSRLACSRQLRCAAQLGPIIGVMKPGGGMST